MADKKPGEYFGGTLAIERGGKLAGSPETMGGYFAQYEPGSIVPPANPHVATLLKAGSDIVFQIHYTPNGKATTDQTKVGFIFSDTATGHEICERHRDQSHIRHPSRC